MNLGYLVNLVQVMRIHKNKTSVFPWEGVRMLPKGVQALRKALPPLHHLMMKRQVIQAIQCRVWLKRQHHWKRCYHRWVILLKCPSISHAPEDCCLNNLYSLSINVTVQPCQKIEHAIECKWEWLLGMEEVINPTFSCMEWNTNCQHFVRSLSWGSDNSSSGPHSGGGHPVLWEALTEWRASLPKRKRHWVLLKRSIQLGR